VLRNHVAQGIEDVVVAVAVEQPACGQVRVANEPRKRGLTVSAAGARCVWQRHETMNKCLKALEGKIAKEEPDRDDRAEERRDMIIASLTHVRKHRSLPFASEGLRKLSCLLQVRNWR
jgi:hypothetical protein